MSKSNVQENIRTYFWSQMEVIVFIILQIFFHKAYLFLFWLRHAMCLDQSRTRKYLMDYNGTWLEKFSTYNL